MILIRIILHWQINETPNCPSKHDYEVNLFERRARKLEAVESHKNWLAYRENYLNYKKTNEQDDIAKY